MMQAPRLVANYHCQTRENPLWHPTEKRLYWCDIPNGRIFRYDPTTDAHEVYHQGEPVGGFTIEEDGALLLFMAQGAIRRLLGGQLTTIIDFIPEELDSRFNDVIADPAGWVFCGTMSAPSHRGRLYRLDCDGSLTVILEGIGCSNGMAFSLDGRRMYYTDSYAREICVFDYNKDTGELSNKRNLVSLPEKDGFPDGATVDAEDYLWSAIWDGGCVIRYTPDGREDRRITIPVQKVSSLTFGGDTYSDIYVTTATEDCHTVDDPNAGALFHLNAGVTRVAEWTSKIGT